MFGRRLSLLLAVCVVVVMLASATAVSADVKCSTCVPWWHLTSAARPTSLQAGVARDELQELTVRAPNPTEESFIVSEPIATEKEEFFNGKGEPEFAILPVTATFEEVEKGLEVFYGAGNVKVTGGPGDQTGSSPYVITFTGALADRPLRPISTVLSGFVGFAGEAIVTEKAFGRPDGQIVVRATNLGDGVVNAKAKTVSILDKLPAGLKAVSMEGKAGGSDAEGGTLGPVSCPTPQELKEKEATKEAFACQFKGSENPGAPEGGVGLLSYNQIEIVIGVVVEGAGSGVENEVSVFGGGAPRVSVKRPLRVGGAGVAAPFGVDSYELVPEEEGGAVATHAGSHPFQLTTTLVLNQTLERNPRVGLEPQPVALTKDLRFRWPPGLVGNPTPIPRCTIGNFLTQGDAGLEEGNQCRQETAVGVAMGTFAEPNNYPQATTFAVPLFNVEPQVGEPARFGFISPGGPVLIDTSIRTGADYGITVSVNNIPEAVGFLSSEVTVWGVPGDVRHDKARGWDCLNALRKGSQPPCTLQGASTSPPFLSLPTSCLGELQNTAPGLGVEASSWAAPGSFALFPSEPMPALDGCNRLPFSASIGVTPDAQAASTPTGLTVGVHVPQDSVLSPAGLAQSNVKDTTVALPAGVALNPAAGDGLLACSEAQIALSSPAPSSCPEASKVGTVELETPLLPDPLVGSAYVAAQEANPFGSLIALYVFMEDPVSGVRVKLAGEVTPDPVTGQLVSTFKNTPQAPFEDFKIHFFGGSRAPLSTPALCGPYTTTASISPWSGNEPAQASSTFNITSAPNGRPCQNPLPFAPSLVAGSLNIQAGAFTPFTATMSREDGEQSLQGIVLHMPPGLSGLLSGVQLCGEAQANEGTCGAESLIGETTVSVGLGGTPFSVKGGKVYITGPYKGAPFGLSIVNPAKAGPYDLGKGACDCVLVRAKIEVDPHTAALTVTVDTDGPYKIPTILGGIPLQIKHVNVMINRSGFTFNPTNCSKLQITATLQSAEGAATSTISGPFQATNCAVLKFKPGFKVSTNGHTSKAKGASLHVKLSYPKAPFGSQANIAKVKVDLPKQLPSRLTTLQKACTAAQFNTNPAGCPAASIVGHAKAITPLLPVPLQGPAYFVSNGGQAFPNLIMVLQGYGVTINLVGDTFINKRGITSSTFKTVPDAPVGSFELTLPQGKYSALAALGNLCKSKLRMPTAFVAQNGAVIHKNTKIGVTGCSKHRPKHAKKTRKATKDRHHKQ